MVGQQIGRYRIDKEIGQGGMGVVYKGTQVTLDRTVAIKMLASHLADADASARFQREALTLAKLAHPNIIHIYDVEEFEGSQFIIMEYVDGGSLADTLERTPVLTPQRVVEVMAPVLSGLAAAHKKGIIHRDIKPDNILFSESGRPKVTDFGIAHMRGSHSKTRTGVMLGTPYYMSPEQARGQKVTPAADMYACGVLMYEALTGRVPFTAEDAVSVALMHVQAEAEPIESIRPEVPTALCDVIRRAMAKDPADRFATAAAMEDALLAGGWAPRVSGSGAAVVVPEPADPGQTAFAGPEEASGAGVASRGQSSGLGASLGGLGEGVARLSKGTGSLLTATGTLLRRPGWRGMPMAFWLGSVALGGVAIVGGVQAMSGSSGGTPVNPQGIVVDTAVTTRPSGAGGSMGSRPGSIVPNVQPTTQLTPEQLAQITPGGRDSAATPPQSREDAPVRPPREREPEPTRDSVRRPAPITPEREADTARTPDVVVDDRAWQGTASREIRAVVARQGTALETENRSLFLRDVHPTFKADAAALYDDAVAGYEDWAIETSDLNISFSGRTRAIVTYSVQLFRVDRRSGQSVASEGQERWTMVQERGRWWLMTWNNP